MFTLVNYVKKALTLTKNILEIVQENAKKTLTKNILKMVQANAKKVDVHFKKVRTLYKNIPSEKNLLLSIVATKD